MALGGVRMRLEAPFLLLLRLLLQRPCTPSGRAEDVPGETLILKIRGLAQVFFNISLFRGCLRREHHLRR
eukprot:9489263-Pyramimonas_sp.AAC.1